MALSMNGVDISGVYFNGVALDNVYMNGVLVWSLAAGGVPLNWDADTPVLSTLAGFEPLLYGLTYPGELRVGNTFGGGSVSAEGLIVDSLGVISGGSTINSWPNAIITTGGVGSWGLRVSSPGKIRIFMTDAFGFTYYDGSGDLTWASGTGKWSGSSYITPPAIPSPYTAIGIEANVAGGLNLVSYVSGILDASTTFIYLS